MGLASCMSEKRERNTMETYQMSDVIPPSLFTNLRPSSHARSKKDAAISRSAFLCRIIWTVLGTRDRFLSVRFLLHRKHGQHFHRWK